MGIGKSEFEQAEAVKIALEPFIDPTKTGANSRIIGGIVSGFYTDPNGNHTSIGTLGGATPTIAITQDGTTGIWTLTIAAGSFIAGQWQFMFSHNSSSGPDNQYRYINWGVGICADIPAIRVDTDTNIPNDITTSATNVENTIQGAGGHTIADLFSQGSTTQGTVNTISTNVAEIQPETDLIAAVKAKTDNLPAVPAAQSDVTTVGTAVAAVQTTTNAIKAKTDNLPAVPAAQSDVTTVGTAVASVQTTATNTLAQATLARQMQTNRQVVDPTAKTLTVMNDGHGNNVPLVTFDLLEADGATPTDGNMAPTDVFQRNPH